jgi:hypothetical protein
MSAHEQSSSDEIARKIAAEYDAPFLTCTPFAGFPITAFGANDGAAFTYREIAALEEVERYW